MNIEAISAKINFSIRNFIAVAFFLAVSGAVAGETNQPTILKTNIVFAAPQFREVNGQLYNSQLSKLWEVLEGKITEVQSNGIVLQTFTLKETYENVFVRGHGSPGSYGSASDHYERRVTSSDLIPEKRLFIKHYRTGAVDQQISVPAMRTGTVRIKDVTLEEWDCGVPHATTNVISQKIMAK